VVSMAKQAPRLRCRPLEKVKPFLEVMLRSRFTNLISQQAILCDEEEN
jgi:hypothetical protein